MPFVVVIVHMPGQSIPAGTEVTWPCPDTVTVHVVVAGGVVCEYLPDVVRLLVGVRVHVLDVVLAQAPLQPTKIQGLNVTALSVIVLP
jgi:hypothetical protein